MRRTRTGFRRLRRSSHTRGQSLELPRFGVARFVESCRAKAVPLNRAAMLKTFSLSLLFMLALGLFVAAYASIPT